MWTCKHCGQEVENNLSECWNCGTGISWEPPTEASIPDASTTTSQTERIQKKAPLSVELTGALSAIGLVIGLIGLIGGIVVLYNAPSAPSSYASDKLSDIQGTNRVMYLALGWSQIISGTITGLLLYIVGRIGEAVLDIWKAQHQNT
jgi:hypothetical protein